MDIKCEYSQENEFGRLICKADNGLPCKYQRYCTKKSSWENTKNFSSCGRRISNKNGNSNNTNEIIDKNKKESINSQKKNNIKKNNPKKVEIILINKNYIVVKDENGCGMRKYGSFPNAKIGEFIEI